MTQLLKNTEPQKCRTESDIHSRNSFNDLKSLELEISKSRILVLLIATIPTAVYLIWFFVINNQGISNDTANWGTFGDFFGGILNPLIAFFAFYWLTKSVLIQKTELSETRETLTKTENAQKDQAEAALRTAKLQTINILLSAINNEISCEREYINYAITAAQKSGRQFTILTREGKEKLIHEILPTVNQRLNILVKEQSELISEVKKLAIAQNH